jgi:hypothetical protein
MKAYVVSTGVVFLIIFLAHIARLFSEGMHPITQPVFIFTSLLSVTFTIWAWRIFCRLARPNENA